MASAHSPGADGGPGHKAGGSWLQTGDIFLAGAQKATQDKP